MLGTEFITKALYEYLRENKKNSATIDELSQYLGESPKKVSKVLKDAENLGYVELKQGCFFKLTEKGEKIAQKTTENLLDFYLGLVPKVNIDPYKLHYLRDKVSGLEKMLYQKYKPKSKSWTPMELEILLDLLSLGLDTRAIARIMGRTDMAISSILDKRRLRGIKTMNEVRKISYNLAYVLLRRKNPELFSLYDIERRISLLEEKIIAVSERNKKLERENHTLRTKISRLEERLKNIKERIKEKIAEAIDKI